MEKDKYLLNSLSKALLVINILSKHESLSLAEISKLSNFDKASTFRILYTLEANNFVEKSEDARYKLGLAFLKYGSIVTAKLDLVSVSKPLIQKASLMSHVPIHLGVISGNRVITIHIENSSNDLEVTGRVGMSAQLYVTAMGRVLLSSLSDTFYQKLCEDFSFKQYSSNSIKNKTELDQIIIQTREHGYATDINDRYPGFGSVAVPIRNYSNQVVAAISVVTLSQNIEQYFSEYLDILENLAASISENLGYKA
ncbi:IclR family transcriptional regulator [Dielma fastidiosa]|uniref:IclR family transcriptional regulator n=1 Tax=Dielma fastidiosa TaxID=1034346 RepID=A0A318KU85_9FIRM|nr:IclR family transcriptional regulator [Dielma fastidiosa]PXX80132.1 IclR family transcriptional regulator [Dielma fastidiosa]